MLKWSVAAVVLMAAVIPAMALDTYNLTLDPAQSKITITGGTQASSPLVGTMSLKLGTPSGSFNTRDWDVMMELDTLTARNTQFMSFVAGIYPVTVDVDKFGLVDFNQDKNAIPSVLLAGGPNKSSGVLATAVKKDIHALLFGVQPLDDTDWEDGFTWNIEVSDADHIGVAGTGDVEAHVWGEVLGNQNELYQVELFGRGVPEPATLSLITLAGLAMLRRRR